MEPRTGTQYVKDWMFEHCRFSMNYVPDTEEVNMAAALSDFTKYISARMPPSGGGEGGEVFLGQ